MMTTITMIKIECDVWEQKQLSEYLMYAKKKLCEECNQDKITVLYLKIELDKIDNLLRVINGKGHHDYLLDAKAYRQMYSNEESLTKAEKELSMLSEVK